MIDVEVPFELSEARIAGRWQQSYERALAGADELGGRWVPSEYARNVYAGPEGRSLPEFAAEQLAETGAIVMRFRRFNTAGEGQPRTLDVDQSRTAFGRPLVDTALVQTRTAAAQSFPTSRRPTRGPDLGGLGR